MPNSNIYAAMCILMCQRSSIALYQFLRTNLHAYSHLWQTLALPTSYSFLFTSLASDVTRSLATSLFLVRHVKDMLYRQ
jgi:hypothetical protein